jgi:hypothetical protein
MEPWMNDHKKIRGCWDDHEWLACGRMVVVGNFVGVLFQRHSKGGLVNKYVLGNQLLFILSFRGLLNIS